MPGRRMPRLLALAFTAFLLTDLVSTYPVEGQQSLSALVQQAPASITQPAPGVSLVDFGKVAFGNLLLHPPTGADLKSHPVIVRFGENLLNGRIDQHPPGAVRFTEVIVDPAKQAADGIVVAPSADRRNTKSPAVLTPAEWGVVTPFRWVEVEGWPGDLRASQIVRRAAFDRTWRDDAATFQSSDPMLDRIWALSHDTMKATTFAGIFVDGDRERLAYEADAYLNQLGYYAGDADPALPRATFERLLQFPTWPSEWAPHMVFIAHADWMHTGDLQWLTAHYGALRGKLLNERVGPDGLVMSSPAQARHGDIVDWPTTERDGYVFTGVNTVVNAFHLRALREMADLAAALGKQDEAEAYRRQEELGTTSFQRVLFDPARHLYRDGTGTDHASDHANLFPLAFGLVPQQERSYVAKWLVSRGMAPSVYAAQYLMEALFENGETTAALHLMTAPGDRSWRHMVDSGTTLTWEAWDQKYKPNQDWNHAWGAAPANLLPRFVLGVQPLRPGWAAALVQPHIGDLQHAAGRLPTPHGELFVSWAKDKGLHLSVKLPQGTTAQVKLPAVEGATQIRCNGKSVAAHQQDGWWVLDKEVTGMVEIAEQ